MPTPSVAGGHSLEEDSDSEHIGGGYGRRRGGGGGVVELPTEADLRSADDGIEMVEMSVVEPNADGTVTVYVYE